MPTKYRAVRTDGYASKKERNYAEGLKTLHRVGEIFHLEEQKKFPLIAKSEHGREIFYLLDFRYFDKRDAKWHHVDVKGFRTSVYKLKKRMMAERYGIVVEEV